MCHVNIIFIIPILQKGKQRLNNQITHPSSKGGSWNQIFSYHLLCFSHRSQSPINTCWVGLHWKWACIHVCTMADQAGPQDNAESRRKLAGKWNGVPENSQSNDDGWLYCHCLSLTQALVKSGATYRQKKKKKDIKHFRGRQVQLGAGQSGHKHWTKAKRKQQRSLSDNPPI